MKWWALVLAAGCAGNPGPQAATATATAAAPDTATAAEVVTVADAAAVPSKKPPGCQTTTAPGGCFHKCQPAPEVALPATPLPKPCADAFSGLLWATGDGKPPGPPTLQVELGAGDVDSGAFVPYGDGQWAPIVQGIQGGVHVWAALRVALPNATGPKVVVEVAGHAKLNCKVVATQLAGATKAQAIADPTKPGTFTTAKALVPGLAVAFEDKTGGPYCGQWVEVVVEVREPVTQQWGRASAVVRLFALDNLSK